MKEKLSLTFGTLAGVVSYFVGGFDVFLSVFVTVLAVDTLTGMLKAWNEGNYESKKFRSGFIKKVTYLLGIVLAVQIDMMLKTDILRNAVIGFFTFNESMSIVENMGSLGVNFPEIFTNAIKSLDSKESKED